MQFQFRMNMAQVEKIFTDFQLNKEFGIRQGMYKVGEQTKTILQNSFTPSSQAKGRYYTSFKKKKFSPPHRASAPGQAPAEWTGQYRHSITVGKIVHTAFRWVLQIFTDIPYAKTLEFGGINDEGAYVAPRPMWRKVVHQVRSFAGQIISFEVGKAVKMKGGFGASIRTIMPWHS